MTNVILEARDIRYRYPRGMEAVRGISFHVRRGEKVGELITKQTNPDEVVSLIVGAETVKA